MPTIAQRLKDEGKIEGMQVGEKKGRRGEKRETIRRMLNQGFPLETIAQCTDLKTEEIKKLMH